MEIRENATFAVGGTAWAVAVLIQSLHAGLLNSLLNPFMWWMSLLEVVEFTVWLVGPGSIGYYLANFGGRESLLILAGLVAAIGWVALGVAFARRRGPDGGRKATIGLVLNLLFVPVLSLGAVVYYFRNESAGAEPGQDQPSA